MTSARCRYEEAAKCLLKPLTTACNEVVVHVLLGPNLSLPLSSRGGSLLHRPHFLPDDLLSFQLDSRGKAVFIKTTRNYSVLLSKVSAPPEAVYRPDGGFHSGLSTQLHIGSPSRFLKFTNFKWLLKIFSSLMSVTSFERIAHFLPRLFQDWPKLFARFQLLNKLFYENLFTGLKETKFDLDSC